MGILLYDYSFNVLLCSRDNDGQDPHKKQLRDMFNRLAGSDKEIDAEELQDILTISLKQGIASYVPVLIIKYDYF